MNVEPLGLRVLVRPIENEAKTASGLILPDSVHGQEFSWQFENQHFPFHPEGFQQEP